MLVREELVKGKFLRQSINLALLALALVSESPQYPQCLLLPPADSSSLTAD